MECKIKNSVEYRDLKRVSTLSEQMLDAHCDVFYNTHKRLPKMDEIPGSNSSTYLKNTLNLNLYEGTDTQTLLDFTGTNSILDAVININNHYTDLISTAIDLKDRVILKTKQRPNTQFKEITETHEINDYMSKLFILDGLDTLRKAYGCNFIEISNFELELEKWSLLMPTNKLVKAFIYNGNIYINTDHATADSKVHEMLHLLLGSLRFTNPELYFNLVLSITLIKGIESKLNQHRDKTRNDALEEVFVSEVSKLLTGIPNSLESLPLEEIYEILHNIKRTLDTLLLGDYSINTISNERLFTMSIKDIAKEVNSDKLTNNFKGTFNIEGSEIHRKLANLKSYLLKKGDLIELCD